MTTSVPPVDSGQAVPTALSPPLSANGAAIALIDPAEGTCASYDTLAATVDRLARGLAGIGVEPGDVVAYALPNATETIAVFFGVTAARAVAAPLNPGYTRAEFGAYLADLRPSAMLFHGEGPLEARRACSDLDISTVKVDGLGLERLAMAGAATGGELRMPDADDIALLLHTSGTTSKPKSVPLRNRNLGASARAIALGYRLGPDDVSHCLMPLFHVHGLVGSTLAALHAGGAVIVPPRFSARAFWRDGQTHGTTWFSAVPTIHQALLARTGSRAPNHRLRFARSCSAALVPALHRDFEGRFGVPLVEAYGMTEAAHQIATNPLPPDERRTGTVGCATGTEIAIVDDAWQLLPPGATGEVAVRGPGVVEGYVNAPEATAGSFNDGWFRTGDSGVSMDGYLQLAGRIKELINRAGEKISPHEVEGVLLQHPTVLEAVAFALPDDKYGEVVGAVVVGATADAAALQRHCAEHLAAFKVPARVSVLAGIPKGPTGKVQRRLLPQAVAS
jgi:acyl-CoA synthetase (AMP-forming)/AMP-acid ligase II